MSGKFKVGDKVKIINENYEGCVDIYHHIFEIESLNPYKNYEYKLKNLLTNYNNFFNYYELELVEPAKEEFYKKDDLVIFETGVYKIYYFLDVEHKHCYIDNQDHQGLDIMNVPINNLQGKLVPLKETDEIKEGEEVWCIDDKGYEPDNILFFGRKYIVSPSIYNDEVKINSNNIAYKIRFARLVKPPEKEKWSKPDEFGDQINMTKFYELISNFPSYKPLSYNLLKNKEESKMDIKEVSKENIKEAMKIAEQEKKTQEIEFAKGNYYQYLNQLDEYERGLNNARTKIKDIELLKSEFIKAHPEFSKKVKC